MSFEWTTAHTEILAELCAEGLSAREIAERLGGDVTRNSVIGRVHRLGLRLEKKPGGHRVKALASYAREAKPKRASAPPGTPPVSLRTPMIEASFHVCRYPLWEDAGAPDYPVCGHPGYPYCPQHARLCEGRGTQSERDAAPKRRAA